MRDQPAVAPSPSRYRWTPSNPAGHQPSDAFVLMTKLYLAAPSVALFVPLYSSRFAGRTRSRAAKDGAPNLTLFEPIHGERAAEPDALRTF